MILLAALALCAPLAQGVQVPPNKGWVTDGAGLLSAGEAASLEALMESYRKGSGHEIAVLTVPDLGGRPIEELGLAVGRAWGLGREGKNDSALLLVARDEHRMRIEVARGLEDKITDGIAGRIIRDVIAPQFKQGRYADGLRDGLLAMQAAAGGDYAPLERGGHDRFQGIGVIVFVLLLLLVLSRRVRRGYAGGGGMLPWILASELGRSQRSGLGGLGGFGGFGGRGSGGGFGGFGGGGGFSGGGASGRW